MTTIPHLTIENQKAISEEVAAMRGKEAPSVSVLRVLCHLGLIREDTVRTALDNARKWANKETE